jgi:CRISPR-associated protein Csb1
MSEVNIHQFDDWLAEGGPVAIVSRQYLVPATQSDDAIFPPSYADPMEEDGPPVYNIDGQGPDSVCVLDSIPSQANRLEPMFAREPYSPLVPQIRIRFKDGLERNLLEIGHRIADAAFRGTELDDEIRQALRDFGRGDAAGVAKLAPTSLVFGAWDSRVTHAKIPRLINSIIRARDVVQLKRSAQYFPAINYDREGLLPDGLTGKPADYGLAEAPAVHQIGGVRIKGLITRDASLNLVSLRYLRCGADEGETLKLRRYILGLSLIALVADPDLNLRQGCLLTLDPARRATSELVFRDGRRDDLALNPRTVLDFARAASKDFGVSDGPARVVGFDAKRLGSKLAKPKKKGNGAKTPDVSSDDQASEAGEIA